MENQAVNAKVSTGERCDTSSSVMKLGCSEENVFITAE